MFPEDKAETNGRDVSDFLKTDRAGVNFVNAAKDAPLWEPRADAGKGDEASAGDDDALITELATMPPMKYERERKKAAERLGVRAPILDRLVAAERAKLGLDKDDGKQGHAISFPEPELVAARSRWRCPTQCRERRDRRARRHGEAFL